MEGEYGKVIKDSGRDRAVHSASGENYRKSPPHDELDQVANDTAEAFIEAYKECEEIIRKHMNDGNDGWITVEERLPEENGI